MRTAQRWSRFNIRLCWIAIALAVLALALQIFWLPTTQRHVKQNFLPYFLALFFWEATALAAIVLAAVAVWPAIRVRHALIVAIPIVVTPILSLTAQLGVVVVMLWRWMVLRSDTPAKLDR